LDALLERLATGGIEHEPIETYSNGVRHVKVPDPDGNALALAERGARQPRRGGRRGWAVVFRGGEHPVRRRLRSANLGLSRLSGSADNVTLSDTEGSGRTRAEPICAAIWVARVPVSATPGTGDLRGAGDLPTRAHAESAPRGALLYPRLSREELEGRFLGLMADLDGKPEEIGRAS